jgi:putative pyruvate formate lyase activating enzyme
MRLPEQPGCCGADEGDADYRVARLMVHAWEEPYISGTRGSGAIFFSGCALGCSFCQNRPISQAHLGERLTAEALLRQAVALLEQGVHNLNLVTPSHYADRLPVWLDQLRKQAVVSERPVPIIWNSSAYESAAALRGLTGRVDVYLPDFKFSGQDLAADLAGAPDYPAVAAAALTEMLRQQPTAVFDRTGLLCRGVAVRHLVLPGHWRDSCQVLERLAAILPLETPLAIMSQYTPQPDDPAARAGHPELCRRVTTWEMRQVSDHALTLGFCRLLSQDRTSASAVYTPDFTEGLLRGRI